MSIYFHETGTEIRHERAHRNGRNIVQVQLEEKKNDMGDNRRMQQKHMKDSGKLLKWP